MWAATAFAHFQRRCTTFVKLAKFEETLFRWLFTDSGAFLPGSDAFLLGSDEFLLKLVFHTVTYKSFLVEKVQSSIKYFEKIQEIKQS